MFVHVADTGLLMALEAEEGSGTLDVRTRNYPVIEKFDVELCGLCWWMSVVHI